MALLLLLPQSKQSNISAEPKERMLQSWIHLFQRLSVLDEDEDGDEDEDEDGDEDEDFPDLEEEIHENARGEIKKNCKWKQVGP